MDTCYVDTETTSLRNPWLIDGRRTWEIAVIRVTEADEVLDATWLQIVDVDLAGANRDSLDIGRFHQRWSGQRGARWDVDEVALDDGRRIRLRGVDEDEAAAEVYRLTRGAVLAGSNPGFDTENFSSMLYRHGLPADGGWWHHPRDVPNVAHGWLLGSAGHDEDWTDASYSTGKLSEACGVPVPTDRHSAWADTVWMWQWDRELRGHDSARLKDAELGILPG